MPVGGRRRGFDRRGADTVAESGQPERSGRRWKTCFLQAQTTQSSRGQSAGRSNSQIRRTDHPSPSSRLPSFIDPFHGQQHQRIAVLPPNRLSHAPVSSVSVSNIFTGLARTNAFRNHVSRPNQMQGVYKSNLEPPKQPTPMGPKSFRLPTSNQKNRIVVSSRPATRRGPYYTLLHHGH